MSETILWSKTMCRSAKRSSSTCSSKAMTCCAQRMATGRRLSQTENLDLIVVDLMLPRLSGLDDS